MGVTGGRRGGGTVRETGRRAGRTGCRAVYGSLRLSGATPGTGPGAAGAERLGRRSGASTPSQRPRLGRSIVARRQAHRLWTAAAISAGGSGAEEADWAGELRARRSRKKPAARPSPGREYERRGSDRVAAPPEGRRAAPNRRRASAAGSSSQSSSLPPNLHFMPALFSSQDTSASVSGLRRPAVRGRSSPKFSPTNSRPACHLPACFQCVGIGNRECGPGSSLWPWANRPKPRTPQVSARQPGALSSTSTSTSPPPASPLLRDSPRRRPRLPRLPSPTPQGEDQKLPADHQGPCAGPAQGHANDRSGGGRRQRHGQETPQAARFRAAAAAAAALVRHDAWRAQAAQADYAARPQGLLRPRLQAVRARAMLRCAAAVLLSSIAPPATPTTHTRQNTHPSPLPQLPPTDGDPSHHHQAQRHAAGHVRHGRH